MAYLLHLTLHPDGVPPNEGWHFQVGGTSQSGFSRGPLRLAVTSALALAADSRRGAVVITQAWAG